jgi:hypothetical protein
MKIAVFWDVEPWYLVDTDRQIALIVEEVSSSETSVNIYQTTRCNILEDSQLETLLYLRVTIKVLSSQRNNY